MNLTIFFQYVIGTISLRRDTVSNPFLKIPLLCSLVFLLVLFSSNGCKSVRSHRVSIVDINTSLANSDYLIWVEFKEQVSSNLYYPHGLNPYSMIIIGDSLEIDVSSINSVSSFDLQNRLEQVGGYCIEYGNPNLYTLFCCEYGNIQYGLNTYLDGEVNDSLRNIYEVLDTKVLDSQIKRNGNHFVLSKKHKFYYDIWVTRATIDFCTCVTGSYIPGMGIDTKSRMVYATKIGELVKLSQEEEKKFAELLQLLLTN